MFKKYQKLSFAFAAAVATAVLFVATSSAAISNSFTNTPQKFTELFFVNSQNLPSTITAGHENTVKFSVINHRGAPKTFVYRVLITENGKLTTTKTGYFILTQDQSITVPLVFSARRPNDTVEVTVELPDQSQLIHFRSRS